MFYAHFVLAKKGPLARIWLAAHWDKKLTKAHVFEINIEHSVEGILQPKVKMALRTSGHLLLGIVRIYSRKAKYLLADCNEAFIKIKMAFRPGVVDLPEGNREAAVATITLPEVFHDFDTAMPDITIDMDSQVALNQCRAEDITIKEDYGSLSLINDGFDDFDEVEVVRDAANIDDGFNRDGFNFDNPPNAAEDNLQDTGSTGLNQSASPPSMKDNVPIVTDCLLDNDAGSIFEAGGLFDEPIAQISALDNNNIPDPVETQPPVTNTAAPEEDSDDDMYDVGPPSMGPPSLPSSPETPAHEAGAERQPEADAAFPDDPLAADLKEDPAATAGCSTSLNKDLAAVPEMPPPPALSTLNQPQLQGDSFALAPLDATIVQGAERTVKAKRKRKLIVDEVKNISGEEMKSQLSDTSDIVTSLDLAPPTKRLMHWKETGGVEKLFALPGHPILSKTLSRLYQRHLTTRSIDNEEAPPISPEDEYEPARKKICEIEPGLPPDLTNVNPTTFERSYPNDSDIIPNPGMDISLNMPTPQHPMFHLSDQPEPQLINSIMSPTHMIHQMMPSDMSPLAHGSQMMQPPSVGVLDPGSHLPTLDPNLHEMPTAGLSEFTQSMHPSVIEPMPQHLISNFLPSTVENQGQSVENQLSQSPAMDPVHNNHPSLDTVVATNKETENCIQNLDINGVNSESCVPQPFTDELCFDKVMASNHIDQHILHTENELRINEQGQLPEIPPFGTVNNAAVEDTLLDASKQPEVQNDVDNLSVAQRPPEQSDDDDDDYGAPASVGPIYPEEQMADETYEQFEERILTKRTTHMLHIIHHQIDNDKEVKLSELSRNNKRKQVAQKFYTLLVLKKQQAVELQQNGSYSDLIITKGPKFSAVYNAN